MDAYLCTLTKREEVAEDTLAFRCERPRAFQFKAGQCADLTLVKPPVTDARGVSRTFSIASPPFEDELLFATRLRESVFKLTLKALPPGMQLTLEGPRGSFTLHKDSTKPGVFLAGGIGITPCLSILRQAARDKLRHPLFLFYANRRPEDAAFLDVLDELANGTGHFRFFPTMTDMPKSRRKWDGETGCIDRQMLVKYLQDIRGPIYYVAGPPAMVRAMREMLAGAGVGEEDVRSEEFGGY